MIFDCDGVLVDSEEISNRLFVEVLAEHGGSLSYAEARELLVGLSLPACIRLVEERAGRALAPGFAEAYEARVLAALAASVEPVPGVLWALEQIPVASCVASSGSHAKIRTTLGRTGLLARFQGRIFSASEVRRGKPAPDLFLHAAHEMGMAPGRCAVVEDSVYGVRAAVAAGMRALGYAGPSPGAELAREGAEVFHDMQDLPRLLGVA